MIRIVAAIAAGHLTPDHLEQAPARFRYQHGVIVAHINPPLGRGGPPGGQGARK
jgi:hypothetical protein